MWRSNSRRAGLAAVAVTMLPERRERSAPRPGGYRSRLRARACPRPPSCYNPPMEEPAWQSVRASSISLAINAALGVIKLVGGIAGHSSALVADAIESLGDVFGSLIVRAGLIVAARPPDDNHPYGHGKAEPLATLFVAVLLLGAGALIALEAIDHIRRPQQSPAAYTLIVLVIVVALKEAMYRYLSALGAREGSSAISVEAWHHRSDALTSIAAAIGITIALLGGPGFVAADSWAALVACVVIGYTAFRFMRCAIEELMDTHPPTEFMETVRAAAAEVEGAGLVEKVIVRKVGRRFYLDLHLEVDPQLSVYRGHEIAHEVKDWIMGESPAVADVLVHVEPATTRQETAAPQSIV